MLHVFIESILYILSENLWTKSNDPVGGSAQYTMPLDKAIMSCCHTLCSPFKVFVCCIFVWCLCFFKLFTLGKPSFTNCAFFSTLFKRLLSPPPSFWTCMLQFFLNDFKESVSTSDATKFDKIMRKSVEKCQTYPKIYTILPSIWDISTLKRPFYVNFMLP